ncbi:MAG: integrase domain-containing protein [Panacagrimonas sp.]
MARLGIDGGSRVGTKTPLSDERIAQFQQKTDALGRPGIGATLELQRALGLRETEAIRGGRADILDRWARELARDGVLRVIEGSKGGRPREVRPLNLTRAVQAIRAAQAILKSQGVDRLIRRADGTSTAGLKQARGVYRNVCHREDIQSHAARYAFAREQLKGYRAGGFSKSEAQTATSIDLGHGDGRGRFIASVYALDQ